MHRYLRLTAILLALAITLGLIMLFACSSQSTIELITPSQNKVLSNNMPTLSWKADGQFNFYEIWIDNILMDTVAGNLNIYIPFPMAFGEHQWQVIGVAVNKKVASTIGKFIINDNPLTQLPEQNILLRYNWKIAAASEVNKNGSELSTNADTSKAWVTTTMPATVLTALVRNGVYPNPYVGLNNMRIPDCNDEFNAQYNLLEYSHIKGKNPWGTPYWFTTSFELNDSLTDKLTWLNFGEINYRAAVWLNGQQIADTAEMVGMERHFRFNVTALVRPGVNYLAVLVYPVNHPGKPDPEPVEAFGDPGTNMADGMISKDYTKWDMLGWDWQPPVRDRNMGLVEDVYVQFTDAVEIDDLYVTSNLNLPDTTKADITITANMLNHSGKVKEAKLVTTITGTNHHFSFEKSITIDANGSAEVFFDKSSIAQLQITNPDLWWPIGYGNPNLYKLKLELITPDGEKAIAETNFGIREVETYLSKAERVYKINGKTIYCKGGNWVIDMMLNWNSQRYEDEILLTRNSNLNILRVWGPTGAPPVAFYHAADKYGILLWQDFLNDYWGTFKNTPGYIPNEDLFVQATEAIVKKYRNHPSLVIWCGGNEGPNPREKIIVGKILPELDGRDSKHYLKISNGDGLHGGGPYHTMQPHEYFTHRQLWGFSSEIGPSGMPVYESMTKFLPNLGLDYAENAFPVNGEWAYHDATDRASDDRKFSFFDKQVRNYYGEPASVRDYMDKSQLVNYDVYRASIESINRYLWDKASGIALWKSNSSWPSLTWQIYDWYLQAHAGLYGVKKAAAPLVVQFNRDSNTVVVLNASYQNITNGTIKARLLDSSLKTIWEQSLQTTLAENAVTRTGWKVPVTKEVCFLTLQVLDENSKVLADNFYWLSTSNNFKSLQQLPSPTFTSSVKQTTKDNQVVYSLNLKNTSSNLALMVAISLNNRQSGIELLPAIYSDNYITLLPGQEKLITISMNKEILDGEMEIQCKPFNSQKTEIINIQNQ